MRKWKKLLAVGCSHGPLIDKKARAAVLKFRRDFRPDMMIHLGDFCDMAALRAGAKGSSDESEPIQPDLDSGLGFLEELECNLVFSGNHEDRMYRLAHSTNAIVSLLASELVEKVEQTCKRLRAEFVPYHIINGWRKVGGYSFGHGYMFNELACRDHAEMVGNCVFAHTHRAGMAKGRRSDNPTGYCVGTLTNVANMDYAKARRATTAWSGGMVWGEYCDDQSVLWLHEQPRNVAEWRLP